MITIKLDQKSSVPFYKQIIDQVRCGISSKQLGPGEQLPTVRELAVSLQVNPNTIRKAYGDMEVLGWIYTQQGTGTFVGHKKLEMDVLEKQRIMKQLCDDFLTQAHQYGITADELLSFLKER